MLTVLDFDLRDERPPQSGEPPHPRDSGHPAPDQDTETASGSLGGPVHKMIFATRTISLFQICAGHSFPLQVSPAQVLQGENDQKVREHLLLTRHKSIAQHMTHRSAGKIRLPRRKLGELDLQTELILSGGTICKVSVIHESP